MDRTTIEKKYNFIKGFKDDNAYRKSFNQLTRQTYGFDFEDWYSYGYWQDRYCPYSLLDGDKIIANVSVNFMDFERAGEVKRYIQLGTVMTEPSYRNQGLIRYLIENILKEFEHNTEGFYLFANDSVLDFYPKFGFQPCLEYEYSSKMKSQEKREDVSYTIHSVDMSNKENQKKLYEYIGESKSNHQFSLKYNSDLIMFYTTGFMAQNVYYIEGLDAYAVAETEGSTLHLHDIFCKKSIHLDDIVTAFQSFKAEQVIFGFVPNDYEQCTRTVVNKEDSTLFILSKELRKMETEFLMFPALSHA